MWKSNRPQNSGHPESFYIRHFKVKTPVAEASRTVIDMLHCNVAGLIEHLQVRKHQEHDTLPSSLEKKSRLSKFVIEYRRRRWIHITLGPAKRKQGSSYDQSLLNKDHFLCPENQWRIWHNERLNHKKVYFLTLKCRWKIELLKSLVLDWWCHHLASRYFDNMLPMFPPTNDVCPNPAKTSRCPTNLTNI